MPQSILKLETFITTVTHIRQLDTGTCTHRKLILFKFCSVIYILHLFIVFVKYLSVCSIFGYLYLHVGLLSYIHLPLLYCTACLSQVEVLASNLFLLTNLVILMLFTPNTPWGLDVLLGSIDFIYAVMQIGLSRSCIIKTM